LNQFDFSFVLLDFEQQLGDYEKELKMLRVKLDAANKELECNTIIFWKLLK